MARNIGHDFDQGITLEDYVNKVTKDSYFQLYQLRCIMKNIR